MSKAGQLWQLHRRQMDEIIDKTELEDWRFYDLRINKRDILTDAIEQRGEFSPEQRVRPIHFDAIDTDARETH